MHADVREVRRHDVDRLLPAEFKKTLVARGVELQQ
jgi:hypothetical protein